MGQVQLVITMTSDGRVEISGPLEQKVLCYGLLEMGKDCVRTYHERAQGQGQIVPVSAPLPFKA